MFRLGRCPGKRSSICNHWKPERAIQHAYTSKIWGSGLPIQRVQGNEGNSKVSHPMPKSQWHDSGLAGLRNWGKSSQSSMNYYNEMILNRQKIWGCTQVLNCSFLPYQGQQTCTWTATTLPLKDCQNSLNIVWRLTHRVSFVRWKDIHYRVYMVSYETMDKSQSTHLKLYPGSAENYKKCLSQTWAAICDRILDGLSK